MRKFEFILLLVLTLGTMLAQTITIEETYPGFTNMQVCKASGDYVYILDHYKVITYDLSSGDFADTLNVGEYVRNIDFSGSSAVLVGITTLYLVDISDPSALTVLSELPVGTGSMGWDVAIDGSMAYIAAQNRAIIAEISGTTLIQRGSYFPLSGFPMVRSIEIKGETMYVGDANGGIYAVDVSTPASPVLRMTASTPGNKVGLEIIPGDKLIVADGAYTGVDSTSVRIFDVPSATTCIEVGSWVQLGGDAIKTHTPSPYDRLALADGEGGVKILDVSAPATPYLVVEQPTSDIVNGVTVSGDTIFVAGRNNFYIMTTDAFSADTDTVITHVPASVDSVWPDHLIISACDEVVFDWYFTEGTNAIVPESTIIIVNGITFTGIDPEVETDEGGVSFESGTYDTGDTIVAELSYMIDEAGSIAVGLGLSATIVLDLDPPRISDVFPADGDSLPEDSVVITGELMDAGPAELADTEFRVIVDGVSYSPTGAYLDFTPPDFICTPMGSFSPGDEIELCFLAEDMPDECIPNILDTCWNFYISATGIGEAEMPGDCSITAYPNPFNAATVFHVNDMPIEDSPLIIYDIHGRIIDRIEQNEFNENRVVWEPSNEISSGLYLARMPGGSLTKVVLLR